MPILILLITPSVCSFGLQNDPGQTCSPLATLPLVICGLVFAVVLVVWNLLQTALLTSSFRSPRSFFSAQLSGTQTVTVALVSIACVSETYLSPTQPTAAAIIHCVVSIVICLLLLYFPPFLSNYVNVVVSIFPAVSIVSSIFSLLTVPLSFLHPIVNNLIFFIGIIGCSVAAAFGMIHLVRFRLDKTVLIRRNSAKSMNEQQKHPTKQLRPQMVGSIFTIQSGVLFEHPHIPNMPPANYQNLNVPQNSKLAQSRPLYDAVEIAASQITNSVDLNLKLRYLYHPNIISETEVVGFTEALYYKLLNRRSFRTDPSIYLSYAQFLGAFRPSQRVGVIFSRVSELFPSFTERFVMFRYIKDIEAQESKLQAQTNKDIPQAQSNRTTERQQSTKLEEAVRSSNLARAHMFRFWTILSVKNFNLVRAMKHAEEGISNFVKSKLMIQDLLKEDPRNPTILRQYASILREVEGDLVTSSACLNLAENVEDVLLQEYTEAHVQELEAMMKQQQEAMGDAINQSTIPQIQTTQPKTKARKDLSIPNALQVSIWETNEKVPVRPLTLVLSLLGIIVITALLIFTSIFVLIQSSQSEPETLMIRATIAASVETNYMFEMMQASYQYSGMISGIDEDDEWIYETMANNLEYSEESVLFLNSLLYRMLEVSLETNDWGSKNFEWVVPVQNSVDGSIVENLVHYKLNLYDLVNWADDLLFESLGDDLNPITHRQLYLHATVTAGLTVPFSLTEELKKLVFNSSHEVEMNDWWIKTLEIAMFIVSECGLLLFLFIPTLVSLIRTCSSHARVVADVCQQSSHLAKSQVIRFSSSGTDTQMLSRVDSFVDGDGDDFVEPDQFVQRKPNVGMKMITPAQSVALLSDQPLVEQDRDEFTPSPQLLKPTMPLHRRTRSIGMGLISPAMSVSNGNTHSHQEDDDEDCFAETGPTITPTISLHRRQRSIGAGMITPALSLTHGVTQALSVASVKGQQITPQESVSEMLHVPIATALSHITVSLAESRKKRDERRKKERERHERLSTQKQALQKMRSENEHLLRIDHVNSSIRTLRFHSLPTSLLIRFILGIVLIAMSIAGFFVPTLLIVPQMHLYTSRIIVNEYRRILLTQISFLADMVGGGFTITPASSDVVILNTKYGTPCFTNTTNLQSVADLQETLMRTTTMYAILNQVFLLGTSNDLLTSDPSLDGIEVASTRNYTEDITALFTERAICYYDPETDDSCEGGDVDGLEEWCGLDELLQRVVEAGMILSNTPEPELDISIAENTLITQLTWESLDSGLARIGKYLEIALEDFISMSRVLVLVLVLSMSILAILIALIFIVPIPYSLRKIHSLTKSLAKYGIVREARPPIYTPDMDTSITALDHLHERIVGDLTDVFILVNDPEIMGQPQLNDKTHTEYTFEKQKSQEVILKPLSELVVDSVEMFAIEEALMHASQFPPHAMTQHLQSHIDLFRELLRIYEQTLQNQLSTEEGTIFAVSWMKDHMASDDSLLAVFVVDIVEPKQLTKAVKKGRHKTHGMIQFPRLMGRILQESQIVDPTFLNQILQTHNIRL
ncbi:hypothetical protein BLNAU_1012 [Blattamonas nauphoetae]|uniref:RGS domain-containing protein n=1 Tax=Blattamonas nauphoetae TaxID=2049346 RepID=A0ABQ9YJV0_9EUKA|nr:hypothetical protein BLNAU_1012 [Blattamonas nauphoetae]